MSIFFRVMPLLELRILKIYSFLWQANVDKNRYFLIFEIDFLIFEIHFLIFKIHFLIFEIHFLIFKIHFLIFKIHFLIFDNSTNFKY